MDCPIANCPKKSLLVANVKPHLFVCHYMDELKDYVLPVSENNFKFQVRLG
jgi:hypothetical protein